MCPNIAVAEIGDEHRDRVWKDRNGDYWKWYDDGERRGWKYQSPHNRWRFGGMHIPYCGPYTFVTVRICECGQRMNMHDMAYCTPDPDDFA
jgi:hypothetical protein